MEEENLINKIMKEGITQINGDFKYKPIKFDKNKIEDLKFLEKELGKEEGFENYAGGTPFVDQHLYCLDAIVFYGKISIDHRLGYLLSRDLLKKYLKKRGYIIRKEERTLHEDKSKNILISIRTINLPLFHTMDDYRPYIEVAVGRKFKKRNLKNGSVLLTPCSKSSLDKVLNDLLNVNLNPFAKISKTQHGFKLEFLKSPIEYTICRAEED